MDIAIAIDVGGTKTAAGLVDRSGALISEITVPTPTASAEAVAAEAVGIAQQLMASTEIRERTVAVGIGIPGTIDLARGIAVFAPNLPIRDFPIRKILEEELGLPVFLDNDANLAALGEAMYGAGRGARHLVVLTLGTGIGSGIVIEGRVYRGSSGSAAELGHMLFPQPDGSISDWEYMASGSSLVRRVLEALDAGKTSLALDLAGGRAASITGEIIAQAARKGDDVSLSAFSDLAYWLGIGLANVANIFNPDRIVLGGGMADAADLFLDEARRVMLEKAIPPNGERAELTVAELGPQAALFGGATLAFGGLVPHV